MLRDISKSYLNALKSHHVSAYDHELDGIETLSIYSILEVNNHYTIGNDCHLRYIQYYYILKLMSERVNKMQV